MDLEKSVMWMFFGSVIIGFFITSSLLVDKIYHIESSLTKLYMAVYMALFMVLLEVIMYDYYNNKLSLNYYIILILIIYLIRRSAREQYYVYDKDYLKAMIQHHSSAILTSKKILEKSNNEHVRVLAEQIIRSQETEINTMNRLINDSSK